MAELVAPRFARVNASADGDNEVVAAVTGQKIRVLGYQLTSRTAGLLTVKSGAAGATLAELDLVADTPVPYVGGRDAPAFETAAAAALVFNVPNGVDVVGHLTWIPVS